MFIVCIAVMSTPRGLFLLTAIALFAEAHSTSVTAEEALGRSARRETTICQTAACQRLADFLRKQMNTAVDPCEDLYKFACGGFVRRHPLRDCDAVNKSIYGDPSVEADLPYHTATAIIRNATLKGLRLVNYSDPTTPEVVKWAKRFFESCLAWNPFALGSRKDVANFIMDFARWPLFERSSQYYDPLEHFDVSEIAGGMYGRHSLESFVKLEVETDLFNTDRKILSLEAPAVSEVIKRILAEPTAGLAWKERRERIEDTIFAISRYSSNSIPFDRIRSAAEEVLDFELFLAGHAKPAPTSVAGKGILQFIKSGYNPYSPDSLNVTFKSFNWAKFLKEAVRNEPAGIAWLSDPKSRVLVTDPAYVDALAAKLANTPKHVVANFLLWKVAERFWNIIARDYKSAEMKERDCLAETGKYFRDAETLLYIEQQAFETRRLPAASVISQTVLEAAKETLKDNKWLGSAAKERYLAKINNIVLNVGYPKWSLDGEELARRNPLRGSWLGGRLTYLNHLTRETSWDYEPLTRPVDRTEFSEAKGNYPAANGNAHYDPFTNSLVVPAGNFEYPLFDEGYPEAFNYGHIGFIIGHEIFHGYDIGGVFFDAHGFIRNLDQPDQPWLLAQSVQQFDDRARCVIDDYNRYCYDFDLASLNICANRTATGSMRQCTNGSHTLGENLSDLNGIRTAWKAYKRATSGMGSNAELLRLPGLEEYSMDKLFFVGLGQFFCRAYNPLLLYLTMKNNGDEHSRGDARVNQMAKHFPQFAETFRCRSGARLKPDTVCEVY